MQTGRSAPGTTPRVRIYQRRIISQSLLAATLRGVMSLAAPRGEAGAATAYTALMLTQSRVDLSTFLTGNWGDTVALAIWSDGASTDVAGYGSNDDFGRTEALLWKNTAPEPDTAVMLGSLGLATLLWRCK